MRSFLLVALVVGGCGGDPTGSVCPTTDPPTFDSFADNFFTEYCRACHSANADNRHGAPGSQNYDTEADIKRHADEIDAIAASGPDGTNTSMPDLSGPVRGR